MICWLDRGRWISCSKILIRTRKRPRAPMQNTKTRELITKLVLKQQQRLVSPMVTCTWHMSIEDVPLVEFMYLVFTCMLGESYHRWLGSLFCMCDIFWTLINSFACWFYTGTTGLILFQTVLRRSAPLRWHPVFANVLPKKLATWSWKYMIHDAGMTSNVDLIFSAFTPCSQGFHLQWIMICQTAFLYKSLVGS